MKLTNLPALGAPLEGGIFAGLTTKPDGTHCAVVLLAAKGENLTWQAAMDWASKHGGELPSRPVAALLIENAKDKLRPEWHWTSEAYGDSYAWDCHFGGGYQNLAHKSYEGCAVAVRLIPITGD